MAFETPQTLALHNCVFIQVLNPTPEGRKETFAPHVRKETHSINVLICTTTGVGDRRVEVRSESSSDHAELSLVGFASRLKETLRALRIWVRPQARAELTKMAALPNAPLQPLPVLQDYPDGSEVGAGAASSSSATALMVADQQRTLRDPTVERFVRHMITQAIYADRPGPGLACDAFGIHADAVAALQSYGMIVIETDDFGEPSAKTPAPGGGVDHHDEADRANPRSPPDAPRWRDADD